MSEAIIRAIQMLQDYKYDLASQCFNDNDEGDMLQRRNENKRSTVDAAITGLRAELSPSRRSPMMSEVLRYKAIKLKTEAGNIITYTPHGPDFVPAEAYDQLRAIFEGAKS